MHVPTGAITRVRRRTGHPTELTSRSLRYPADLGICRNPRYKLGSPCIGEYFARVPMSEPTADFDGRNAVYAMKYHTLLSIMYSNDLRFRDRLIMELRAVIKTLEGHGTACL